MLTVWTGTRTSTPSQGRVRSPCARRPRRSRGRRRAERLGPGNLRPRDQRAFGCRFISAAELPQLVDTNRNVRSYSPADLEEGAQYLLRNWHGRGAGQTPPPGGCSPCQAESDYADSRLDWYNQLQLWNLEPLDLFTNPSARRTRLPALLGQRDPARMPMVRRRATQGSQRSGSTLT